MAVVEGEGEEERLLRRYHDDRYDIERGMGFARYAVPTVLGELKRHFRDKGWAVRVPRATQELALKPFRRRLLQ